MAYRGMTAADVPELLRLRAAVRERAHSPDALRKSGITVDGLRDRLGDENQGWVSVVGERIVGFALGDTSTGELRDIAVLPGYEGQGIGTALLEHVESWLQENGWSETRLSTSANRTLRSYSFFLSRGWLPVKESEDGIIFRKEFRSGTKRSSELL